MEAARAFQLCGSNSSIWLIGWVAMREHIPEPGERLDRIPLAHRDEAQQHGRCLAAVVAAEERPVASTNRDVPVSSLRSAIVDLQIAVFQKRVSASH